MGIAKIKHRYSSSLKINKKEQLDNTPEEKKNELKQSADDNKKSKCSIF